MKNANMFKIFLKIVMCVINRNRQNVRAKCTCTFYFFRLSVCQQLLFSSLPVKQHKQCNQFDLMCRPLETQADDPQQYWPPKLVDKGVNWRLLSVDSVAICDCGYREHCLETKFLAVLPLVSRQALPANACRLHIQ